jgi:hypothetical protein
MGLLGKRLRCHRDPGPAPRRPPRQQASHENSSSAALRGGGDGDASPILRTLYDRPRIATEFVRRWRACRSARARSLALAPWAPLAPLARSSRAPRASRAFHPSPDRAAEMRRSVRLLPTTGQSVSPLHSPFCVQDAIRCGAQACRRREQARGHPRSGSGPRRNRGKRSSGSIAPPLCPPKSDDDRSSRGRWLPRAGRRP